MTLKESLARYVDAGFPIIYINSFEEAKTDRIINEVMGRHEVLEWNGASGLVDFHTKKTLVKDADIASALSLLHKDKELDEKKLILKDISGYLEEGDKKVIALLKSMAIDISQELDANIIIVSPKVVIPRELEKFITVLENDYPDQNEIKKLVLGFAEEQGEKIYDELIEEMSMAFKGLTEFEIIDLLNLAIANEGRFTRGSLALIFEQKQQMIKKSGILEMIPLKEKADDIGGLENLKEWIRRKSKVFKNINKAAAFGVDMPKGVLIAGVPGCGKSLTAKVTAQLFEVPLLRLDMGKIMGKYVGESEENMRRSIALAETIAPCVLWIDELEKAFAGINGSGSEVTVRLFGQFLTWMQEKTSPTFVIATANDITKLPPELMRKGRFDEIFFVGLPNANERRKIFEIHIKKRRPNDLTNIGLDRLVNQTDGYSGADIEGVVRDAIENTFSDGKPMLTTEYLLSAINATHSLSEIMKESLDKLSEEYKNRKFKNASA